MTRHDRDPALDRDRGVFVVIPAHDEEVALHECLRDLLAQRCGDICMSIVVVANGCTDRTADVARSHVAAFAASGHYLRVAELEVANKSEALNAADAYCDDSLPRIYLDADVALSATAVRDVVDLLASGRALLAAPRMVVARPRSPLVRAYARVWSALPYVSAGPVGCGFYAVGADARRRWGAFPPIISDDKYVRLHFAASEQAVASCATFTVFLPESLRELLLVRGRWCYGNHQVAAAYPELLRADRSRVVGSVRHLVRRPERWLDTPVFLAVFMFGRLAAAAGVGRRKWQRAESAPRRTAAARARGSRGRPPEAAS